MDLQKWRSSDEKLEQQIGECEEIRNQNNATPAPKKITKVLGVTWDVTKDIYLLTTYEIYCEGRDGIITKRRILKIVALIYDPLGIIAPIIVTFKIFFQQITQMKFSWD